MEMSPANLLKRQLLRLLVYGGSPVKSGKVVAEPKEPIIMQERKLVENFSINLKLTFYYIHNVTKRKQRR
jgi:hypothetical protein